MTRTKPINIPEEDAKEIERLQRLTGFTRYVLIHKCVEAFKKVNKTQKRGK